MDAAVFWLVIIGPTLIGLAAAVWYGDSKTFGLWTGFAGAVLLVLAGALQLQKFIWNFVMIHLKSDIINVIVPVISSAQNDAVSHKEPTFFGNWHPINSIHQLDERNILPNIEFLLT